MAKKPDQTGLPNTNLRDGSITAVFERTGKGKVTYSHRPQTENETWYICLLAIIVAHY